MKQARNYILPAFLVLAITLGGASAAGFVSNFVLQTLAIAMLVWAFANPAAGPASAAERRLGWLLTGLCAIVLLQFLPLPLALWSMLGQREGIAGFARLAGYDIRYPAVSLMPHESLKSAVWALPAIAVAVWMMRNRTYRPDLLGGAIVAMAGLSMLVGALQIGGGRDSPLYFYDITNRGATVGFFANSNHMATLLLVSVPFIAAAVAKLRSRRRSNDQALLAAAGGVLAIVFAGIFINNSLAGYSLIVPVLAASALILGRFPRVRRLAPYALTVLVMFSIGLPFLTDEGAGMVGATASLQPGDRRIVFANSFRAAMDYGPLGSGLGSFREIYRQYQDPLTVSTEYINHAHNDYLEILLETGLPGILLVAAFLAWWFWRLVRIWGNRGGGAFGKAATIASGAILLHSLVDYPLRTAAISCIFAVCIALMARRTDLEASFTLPGS